MNVTTEAVPKRLTNVKALELAIAEGIRFMEAAIPLIKSGKRPLAHTYFQRTCQLAHAARSLCAKMHVGQGHLAQDDRNDIRHYLRVLHHAESATGTLKDNPALSRKDKDRLIKHATAAIAQFKLAATDFEAEGPAEFHEAHVLLEAAADQCAEANHMLVRHGNC